MGTAGRGSRDAAEHQGRPGHLAGREQRIIALVVIIVITVIVRVIVIVIVILEIIILMNCTAIHYTNYHTSSDTCKSARHA